MRPQPIAQNKNIRLPYRSELDILVRQDVIQSDSQLITFCSYFPSNKMLGLCIIYYALYYNYYLFYCLLEVKVIHYEYINYVNSKKFTFLIQVSSQVLRPFRNVPLNAMVCKGVLDTKLQMERRWKRQLV